MFLGLILFVAVSLAAQINEFKYNHIQEQPVVVIKKGFSGRSRRFNSIIVPGIQEPSKKGTIPHIPHPSAHHQHHRSEASANFIPLSRTELTSVETPTAIVRDISLFRSSAPLQLNLTNQVSARLLLPSSTNIVSPSYNRRCGSQQLADYSGKGQASSTSSLTTYNPMTGVVWTNKRIRVYCVLSEEQINRGRKKKNKSLNTCIPVDPGTRVFVCSPTRGSGQGRPEFIYSPPYKSTLIMYIRPGVLETLDAQKKLCVFLNLQINDTIMDFNTISSIQKLESTRAQVPPKVATDSKVVIEDGTKQLTPIGDYNPADDLYSSSGEREDSQQQLIGSPRSENDQNRRKKQNIQASESPPKTKHVRTRSRSEPPNLDKK